jgi:hypothetical protein
MKNSQHFVNRETILSSTSIRHLPLKKMNFTGNIIQLQISFEEFLNIISKLKTKIISQSKKTAINAVNRTRERTNIGETIYEILTSHQYRKSPKIYIPKKDFLFKINQYIKDNKPIELIISIFPCKAHNRLKSIGIYPDFAEILSLFRLLEICLSIKNIYSHGANFIIVADGFKFQRSWRIPNEDIIKYQEKLIKFIDLIDAEKYLKLLDYTQILKNGLSLQKKLKRKKDFLTAKKEYLFIKKIIKKIFPNNYLKKLEVAMKFDPPDFFL